MICWTMMVTTEALGRLALESRQTMNLTRNSRSLRPGFSGWHAALLITSLDAITTFFSHIHLKEDKSCKMPQSV